MNVKTVMLITLGLMLMCSTVSAVDNSDIGSLTLKSYDFSSVNNVPNYVFMATSKPLASNPVNATITYNNSLQCIDYSRVAGSEGAIYITGFYPAVDQTITLTYGIDRLDADASIYLYTNNAFLMLRRNSDNSYRVRSVYTNDTGRNVDTDFTVPAASIVDNRITISITSHDTNRTNTIYYNDTLMSVTPYVTAPGRYDKSPVVSSGAMWAVANVGSGYCTMHVYDISQTIPQKTITAYPTNDIISFGIDYPTRSTAEIGTTLMRDNGQVGTVYYDVKFNTSDTIAYTQSLLDDGWELGIHFSTELNPLSLDDAKNLIDAEMEYTRLQFGAYPTSWCSLHNADNYTHAEYIYDNYGCVWRNGASGVTGLISVMSCLYNNTHDYSYKSIAAQSVVPFYTHHIDDPVAERYSIDRDKFANLSNGYAAAGSVRWVSWYEYYTIGQAQRLPITISENSENSMIYSISNIYPVNININSELSGWVMKSRNGVTESIFQTNGVESFADQRDGVYRISKIPFTVTPESGTVSTMVSTWTTNSKVWTLSSETQQSVAHTIGGFPANTDIDIYRDGIDYDTVTSDNTGTITWVYSGGFSEHTFEAVPHATAGVRDSFVSSWGNTVSMVGAIIVITLAGSMIMMFRGKKDLSEVMNDLPGILLIVALLVTGAIIFGQL